MKRLLTLMLVLCVLLGCGSGLGETAAEEHPVVRIDIDGWGTVYAELYPEIAPISVANFLALADRDFYRGTTFHRIISGFMIQGGASSRENLPPIKGEFAANGVDNPLLHERGVLSMARTSVMDSATSQFFIMHQTSPHLDGQYAAFGRVLAGMDVVDRICAMTPVTDSNGSVAAPDQPVITAVARADRAEAEAAAEAERHNGESGGLFRDAATTVSCRVPEGWAFAGREQGMNVFSDGGEGEILLAASDWWKNITAGQRTQMMQQGATRDVLVTEVFERDSIIGAMGGDPAKFAEEGHNGMTWYAGEVEGQGCVWVAVDRGLILMAMCAPENADTLRGMLDTLSTRGQ